MPGTVTQPSLPRASGGLPVLTDVSRSERLPPVRDAYGIRRPRDDGGRRRARRPVRVPEAGQYYLYDSSAYIAVRAPLPQVDVSFDEGIAQVSNA